MIVIARRATQRVRATQFSFFARENWVTRIARYKREGSNGGSRHGARPGDDDR
jgi:hypothetical protein